MFTSFQPLLLLLCLAAAPLLANLPNVGQPAAAAFPPFSRYEVIIERQPFGRPPATPTAAVAAPVDTTAQQNLADQQRLAKQINMSGVTINPNGATFIGFTDLSVKPPVNYYLSVGASGGGWLVVAADYQQETATIEKDGIRIDLKLGKGLVTGGAPAVAAAAGAPLPSPLTAARTVAAARSLEATNSVTPAFRTVTEQLMGMVASVPLGTTLPPLPVIDHDNLEGDSKKALATPIVIDANEDPKRVTQKEDVAWIKEDLRQARGEDAGLTASSYLKRLQARHRAAEQKRRQEAERLRKLVENHAREQVLAELKTINQQLAEEGIAAIGQAEVMPHDPAAEAAETETETEAAAEQQQ